jgi:hypothetical protein
MLFESINQGENTGEQYVICPKPNCNTPYFVDKDLEAVVCTMPHCRFKFCLKCKEEFHPNLTCEEKKKQLAAEDEDQQAFEKALVEMNAKPCPVCKI